MHTRFGWERASNKVDMKPGDLIEIFRIGYQHWAVYVGDGNVVHLAGLSESAGASSSWFMSFPAVVMKEKLSDVVGNNRYHVNNKYDSKYTVRDPKDIVYLANRRVGNIITYKFFTNNCEHFATSLRYYVPISDQVDVGRGTGEAEAARGRVLSAMDTWDGKGVNVAAAS
ncbi:phospholipase A and acyltransferase 3-like [Erythrolamprus reginae]|uniref:phospholipase A and acyltransferase 3-like n=1 Tax=Erythrolamprus reginae TaxID=121349 RepID=UPI00396C8A3D